jgi:hypothetical protein
MNLWNDCKCCQGKGVGPRGGVCPVCDGTGINGDLVDEILSGVFVVIAVAALLGLGYWVYLAFHHVRAVQP